MIMATEADAPTQDAASASRISELASELQQRLNQAIERIGQLNAETKIISINAKMEAARAGGAVGSAFGVVAQSIQEVSRRTTDVARHLAEQTAVAVTELHDINRLVKGERLSDLAHANIDFIDRNLYERSCDCRWWATDPSVSAALQSPTPANIAECRRRLGQILDSYTVYFDIVVADPTGTIIANGRPHEFRSQGTRHHNTEWFTSAAHSQSGAEFGFASMSPSSLANNQRALVYSASVRDHGNLTGPVLGVLAVVFRWDALAQTIVQQTPLPSDERPFSRVCIVDERGTILADTEQRFLTRLEIPDREVLFRQAKNYACLAVDDYDWTIGHARAPGYETYSTGWHSVVIQRVPRAAR